VDLFAFCSSDHSITVFFERKGSYLANVSEVKDNLLFHNKFYHNMVHIKLCWAKFSHILCSVASDRNIYGWDIDQPRPTPLFQIARHNDIITDFIAADHLGNCALSENIHARNIA
jgi:hypothetical protein